MLTKELTTTMNGKANFDEQIVETFKSKLRGELCLPGDSGYDEARTIWNGMIDRRPGLVAPLHRRRRCD